MIYCKFFNFKFLFQTVFWWTLQSTRISKFHRLQNVHENDFRRTQFEFRQFRIWLSSSKLKCLTTKLKKKIEKRSRKFKITKSVVVTFNTNTFDVVIVVLRRFKRTINRFSSINQKQNFDNENEFSKKNSSIDKRHWRIKK